MALNKVAKELTKAMRSVDDKKTKPYDTAALVKRIEGNIAWVQIPGGTDETPAKMTMAAKVGDTVQVRVSGGRAWLLGNATAPPTDDTIAIEALNVSNMAVDEADRAKQAADYAVYSAGVAAVAAADAQTSANQASQAAATADAKAVQAKQAADTADAKAVQAKAATDSAGLSAAAADEKAVQAGQAAAAADAKAVQAGEAAAAADQKAVEAKAAADTASGLAQTAYTNAGLAQSAASAAQTQASLATTYADSALDQAAVIQDVIGVITWANEHGTFVQTQDTEIEDGKVYFVYDSQTGDYEPVIIPDVADISTYYELSVTEAMNDFIMTHLAVTSRGLWVLPTGKASGTTPASGESQADSDARQASNYKVLLANNGMYVYDATGVAVAQYGTTVTIGNPGGKHVYIDNNAVKIISGSGQYETELASFEANQTKIGGSNALIRYATGPILDGMIGNSHRILVAKAADESLYRNDATISSKVIEGLERSEIESSPFAFVNVTHKNFVNPEDNTDIDKFSQIGLYAWGGKGSFPTNLPESVIIQSGVPASSTDRQFSSLPQATDGMYVNVTRLWINGPAIFSQPSTFGNTVTVNGAATFNDNVSGITYKMVGAIADCTLSINANTGGNPRVVKFLTVDYSDCDSNNGVFLKITEQAGHGNGSSYNVLEDIFVSVNSSGTVSVNTYRYYAQGVTYESTAHYYGDILYTNDTTNKVVKFYVLMGQWSTAYFSPYKRLNASSAGTITQHTGTAVMDLSGTATFGNVFWMDGSTKVSKSGDTMSGGLAINAGSGYSSYNEGLRINAGLQGYATLLIGGTNGTTQGTNDGAWWIGENLNSFGRKLYFAHNGSTGSTTYFYADASNQVTPSLQIGKDLKVLGKTFLSDTATIDELYAGSFVNTGSASFANGLQSAGQIKTSFKNSIAMGSLCASSTSVTTLLDELRYSSGCSGSVSITSAYTNGNVTIPAGWYNFHYMPHRSGGLNGAASSDNTDYGSLFLSGMTLSGLYVIRYANGNIAEVQKLYSTSNEPSGGGGGNYMPLSGGQFTGPISFNTNSLPQFSGAIPYFVGIEAFADGGTLKWQSAGSCSVGYATSAGSCSGNAATATYATSAGSATDSTKLPLAGGTMTGQLVLNTMNTAQVNFRPNHNSYNGVISYQTAGNEAMVFSTQNAVTSFMFVNGENSPSDSRWKSLTPGLQIKNNCVSIGALIGDGTTPSYKLSVSGSSYFSQRPQIVSYGAAVAQGDIVRELEEISLPSVSSGSASATGQTAEFTKSGYRALAVAGWQSTSAYVVPITLFIADNTTDGKVIIQYRVRAVGGAISSGTTFNVYILWLRL